MSPLQNMMLPALYATVGRRPTAINAHRVLLTFATAPAAPGHRLVSPGVTRWNG